MKINKNKGITLIALVVTIIVLLILAGVTLSLALNNNGLISRTKNAKVEQIEASEKEAIAIAYNGVLTDKLGSITEGEDFRKDLEDELKKNGYKVEVSNNGKKVTFTDTGNVYTLTIATGKVKGPKTSTEGTTLGDVYGEEDGINIGDSINYSANNQSNWIVIGQEDNGNVLITTETSIADGFLYSGTAKNWLYYDKEEGDEGYDETYEKDGETYYYSLNKACEVYGSTLQNNKVAKARSINLDDINNLTGFNSTLSGLEFDEYTFGTTLDYENKQVDFYYPSEAEAENKEHPYWRKATNLDTSTTFKNDWYYYSVYEGTGVYGYAGGNGETTLKNMDIVIGLNGNEFYWVASRAAGIGNNNRAYFGMAYVNRSAVWANYDWCSCGYSDGFSELGALESVSIRPVVSLPYDLQVEEQQDGTYDLVE